MVSGVNQSVVGGGATYWSLEEEEGGRGASWKRLRLTLGLRLGSPAAPLGPTGQNGAWLRVADRP